MSDEVKAGEPEQPGTTPETPPCQKPEEESKGESGEANIVSKSFDEWLTALSSTSLEIFQLGTTFNNDEISKLLRILAVSVALTAATLAIGHSDATKTTFAPMANLLSDRDCLRIAIDFVYVGLLYRAYARLFGVRLTLRQSFFCFSLVLIPWIPIVAALRLIGDQTDVVVFVVCTYAIILYLPWAVSRSISLVAGVRRSIAFISVLLGLFVVLFMKVAPTVVGALTRLVHRGAL